MTKRMRRTVRDLGEGRDGGREEGRGKMRGATQGQRGDQWREWHDALILLNKRET